MVATVGQASLVSPELGLDVFLTSGGAGTMMITKLWFGAGGCAREQQLRVHVDTKHEGKLHGDIWRSLTCSKTQVLGEPFSAES